MQLKKLLLSIAFVIPLIGCNTQKPIPNIPKEKPKLVVMITVDQLRGDQLWRYQRRFKPGGFRYFLEQGVAYRNAHYRHSNTFTAVGHASLVTGGNSGQHGLAGNDWLDQSTGKHIYCVEDEKHTLIGEAQVAHQGVSPKNLTSTTISDELILANGRKSRAFSVSIKDRGAILPGGHLGQAYWYNSSSGDFVTSTYYRDQYPEWVMDWNQNKPADRYRDQTWSLLGNRDNYQFGSTDSRSVERGYKHLGTTFPHSLDAEKAKDFYKALRFTPFGDEITLAFAKTMIEQEKIGQSSTTDFLALSLSANDYIGHAYGPNSLETEDNLLRLDRTLADFLTYIDQTVGLQNTLLVLSSDHGVDAIPEYKHALGMEAGRHYPKAFIAAANQALKAHFKIDQDLVKAFWNPSVYLDLKAVEDLQLNLNRVEEVLAQFLQSYPGIASAYTRHDLLKGAVAKDPVSVKVERAFHPQRSGNVLIVQDKNWYLYPKPELFAAMHGSPYSYDTHVPVIFAGNGLQPKKVSRGIAPEDIAPTLAAYLGINPPSGATGEVLPEILD